MTGSIGAGKSVVASVWEKKGAGVVEGDAMGRLALETSSDLLSQLADRFGKRILNPDGSLNRKQLAENAFATVKGQSDLTAMTFPTLYRCARQHLDQFIGDQKPAVFDAALIFEWGVEKDFDLVVTVTAPAERLIERAAQRLGISRIEAEQRLKSQIPADEKARRSDYVIVNDGSLRQLKIRAENLWNAITGQKPEMSLV